jgi:hypothetical protein
MKHHETPLEHQKIVLFVTQYMLLDQMLVNLQTFADPFEWQLTGGSLALQVGLRRARS